MSIGEKIGQHAEEAMAKAKHFLGGEDDGAGADGRVDQPEHRDADAPPGQFEHATPTGDPEESVDEAVATSGPTDHDLGTGTDSLGSGAGTTSEYGQTTEETVSTGRETLGTDPTALPPTITDTSDSTTGITADTADTFSSAEDSTSTESEFGSTSLGDTLTGGDDVLTSDGPVATAEADEHPLPRTESTTEQSPALENEVWSAEGGATAGLARDDTEEGFKT